MQLINMLLAMFLFSGVVAASEKPSEVTTLFKSQAPYGSAKLTWLFLDVYEVSLWTDTQKWSSQSPYAISIRYDMDFSNKELVDTTIAEMQRLGAPQSVLDAGKQNIERLFPAVKDGDRITAYFKKAEVTIFHNGKRMGVIKDSGFAKYFSDIWLSEQTEFPYVRDRLLRLASS